MSLKENSATLQGDSGVTSRDLFLTVKRTGYGVDLATAVDFYSVALVCAANPDRGCGHKAPAVLEELESVPEVSEAWLNREGTLMAVVWTGPNSINRSAAALLKQNTLETRTLSGAERRKAISSFISKHAWFRGAAAADLL